MRIMHSPHCEYMISDIEMGLKNLPLVVQCRHRKDILKAAVGCRYDFSTAHLDYFLRLEDVGESLVKFVNEDLLHTSHDVTEDGEKEEKKNTKPDTQCLNFTSESESESESEDSDDDDGHLQFTDDDEGSEDTGHPSGHGHYSGGQGHGHGHSAPYYQWWGPQPQSSYFGTNVHFMKRTAPAVRSVIHEESMRTEYMYEGFGTDPPPPPHPEGGSVWDFFYPFTDSYDSGSTHNPMDGFGGNDSIPDFAEVRKKEGIPDLEEETEEEGELLDKKHKKRNNRSSTNSAASKCSEPVSASSSHERSSSNQQREANEHNFQGDQFSQHSSHQSNGGLSSESKHSSSSIRSSLKHQNEADHGRDPDFSNAPEPPKSPDFSSTQSAKNPEHQKEASSTAADDNQSSKSESRTKIPRELREVLAEIRDEFAAASGYGTEIALMLEVGKFPKQPSLLQGLFSRILSKPSASSRRFLAAKTSSPLAKSYLGDRWKEIDKETNNLSYTLDSMYVLEKKLYKEVRAEEKLRLAYGKQFKLLQHLDQNGAESTRIDEIRASVQKLDTRLRVSMKPIFTISTKIHKLRDEVLQPQLAELIHGLVAMWRLVFFCHEKQFRAIMDCKMERLKANTGIRRVSQRASRELEMKLKAWSSRLNNWISTQKSFVQSLNGYLTLCLEYDSENITHDRPSSLEAPAIFLMCNDWLQAMETILNPGVADAIQSFASILHELSKEQDEEQRQRAKARDFIPKKVKNRLTKLQLEGGRTLCEMDAMSDDKLLSLALSAKNGQNVEFDSLWQRREEERAKHKDAVEKLHDAASSAQGGLVPLFKALESFSSKALRVHEQVRL